MLKTNQTRFASGIFQLNELNDIKPGTRGDKQKSEIESAGVCPPDDYAIVAE
jgi:hypothetical protein